MIGELRESHPQNAQLTCDMSCVYNMVPHSLLTCKIKHHSVSDKFASIIESFLSDQKSLTKVKTFKVKPNQIQDMAQSKAQNSAIYY